MRNRLKKRLSIRLFIYLFAISVVPLIVMATLLGGSYMSITNGYVNDTIELTSENIKKTVEMMIDDQHNLTREIANNKEIISYLNDDGEGWRSRYDAMDELHSIMLSKRNNVEVHVIARNRNKSLSSSKVPNIYATANWGILYDLDQAREDTITYPVKYKTIRDDYTIMGVATKVYNLNHEFVGYIIIDIYREYFNTTIQEFEDRLKGSFTLMFDNNYVVYDNNFRDKEGLRDSYFMERLEPNMNKGYINKFCFSNVLNDKFQGVYTAKVNYLEQAQKTLKTIVLIIIFISLIISIILSLGIARSITKPIYKLKEAMEKVGRGDLETQVKLNRQDELDILEKEFNKLVSEFKILIKNKTLEKSLTKTAQISALQAQINPHFLYNTLGTVKAMARVGEHENIPSIIMHLTNILRRSIDFKDEKITLAEEISLIKSYIRIQNYRFDNKYSLNIKIPEELYDIQMLPLILQPIIENSIIHGLEKKEGKGEITIKAWIEEGGLNIKISDDGLGISREAIKTIFKEDKNNKKEHDSIGLLNVKKRIKLYYGKDSQVNIYKRSSGGTTVWLKIN